jgi:hypothetical protein
MLRDDEQHEGVSVLDRPKGDDTLIRKSDRQKTSVSRQKYSLALSAAWAPAFDNSKG